jgi:hypothetical protein
VSRDSYTIKNALLIAFLKYDFRAMINPDFRKNILITLLLANYYNWYFVEINTRTMEKKIRDNL